MEKVNHSLTIIIINWNTAQMTCDCLASVYENGVEKDWQVVVVDNASSDHSVKLIKEKFPEVVLIENKENLGFAAANNQVLNSVKSQYYLLLNSDTLVMGDVINQSLKFLQQDSKIGAMGCRVLNTDKSTQLTCSMFPSLLNLVLQLLTLDKFTSPFFGRYQYKYWDRKSEKDVEVISGCYLMLKQEVINNVGVLDEQFFFFGEETDWCRRIRSEGWRLVFSPVGEIIHHGGGSVKKLNHKRDLLLSNAIIKLHKKHFGFLSAALVFFILLLFTLTRSIGWFLVFLIKNNKNAYERAMHFIKSLPLFHNIWKNNLKF